MKAVFVLAMVLVIAAVVVNANDDHKEKHDRNHKNKDRNHKKGDRDEHSGKKDRHGHKHEEKKDRHGGKHEGKKDRSHKKHEGRKDRHAENHASRSVHAHNKLDRQASELCPINREPCCKPKYCIVSCADNKNMIRMFQCRYENWLNEIIGKLRPDKDEGGDGSSTTTSPVPTTEQPAVEDRDTAECTKENENFKCICVEGYMPNDADDSCVKKEDCPLKDGGSDGGDGDVQGTDDPGSG